MKKRLINIILLLPIFLFAQVEKQETDSIRIQYTVIDGDSIPLNSINLREVIILPKLELKSKDDRRTYYRLRRKTIKVYPYAKLAAEQLEAMNDSLETMTKRRHKKKYAKQVQKFIEKEFAEELKKLTRTEGQILIKLIHRQTGSTAFQLIKTLRNGWRAFWFNNTAKLFKISLKREFDPTNVKEDYLIEDILLRNFQSGRLDYQKPAVQFDFYDLTDKWVKTTSTSTSVNEGSN